MRILSYRLRVLLLLLFLAVPALPVLAQQPKVIAARTLPSVVTVLVEDRNGKTFSFGSGFFIQRQMVVTCYHVVKGAVRISILRNRDQQRLSCQLVNADERYDLALLRVSDSVSTPSLRVANTDTIAIGEKVYAVGAPKGYEGTFTDGMLSGIRQENSVRTFQFTAPVSAGSSGGPLLNEHGDVIGVVTGGLTTGNSIYFATSAAYLDRLINAPPVAYNRPSITPSDSLTFQYKPPTNQPAPKVEAQLGVVTAKGATIRADGKTYARTLALVNKGTNLAIIRQSPNFFAVLMTDNTIGWIHRKDIELLNQQVQVKLPSPRLPSVYRETMDVDNSALRKVLREALAYVGAPYAVSGNSRKGINAASLLIKAFQKGNIKLPASLEEQAKLGTPIKTFDDLRAGDRLYFAMGKDSKIAHGAIYLQNGFFVHASPQRKRVDVDRLTDKQYGETLVAARRDIP